MNELTVDKFDDYEEKDFNDQSLKNKYIRYKQVKCNSFINIRFIK